MTKEQALNKCEAEELFYDLLNGIKVTDSKNLLEVLNFTKFHIDKWIEENMDHKDVFFCSTTRNYQLREEV